MGSIPETLGRAVREQGGEIHLNSNVNRILVNNGRAERVVSAPEGRR
jgi:phytoene dehydrogenase-like protein